MTKMPFKNSEVIPKDTCKDAKQIKPSLNISHLIHIYQEVFFPDVLLDKRRNVLKIFQSTAASPAKGEKE